jgi:hypothetical protein
MVFFMITPGVLWHARQVTLIKSVFPTEGAFFMGITGFVGEGGEKGGAGKQK